MNKEYIECACGRAEHLAKLELDEYYSGLWLHVHLDHYLGFWGRLRNAIKYVFGHKSKTGDFDSILIERETARRMRDLLDIYCSKEEQHEEQSEPPRDSEVPETIRAREIQGVSGPDGEI